MTKMEAIKMAQSNAVMACDSWKDYGSLQNAINCHRDNVRDTLRDANSSEWEQDAFAAFDAKVIEIHA